jgi:hypothetical protein
MKKCTVCKKEKELDCFNKNKTKKDGLNNICRECSIKRSKQYYDENKEHHVKVITERKVKTIFENRQRLFEFFKLNPCVDCGNNNPIVLDFDHRDDVDKIAGVGDLIGRGCSWKTVQKEMEKCDVRCANCHRIRTAKQFNWYKGLL